MDNQLRIASFMAAIIVGVGANLGMVLAASMLGNVPATFVALVSSGLAYVCQALGAYRVMGVAQIPQALVLLFQGASVGAWLLALYCLF